jgi:hypothetical protein
MSPKFYRDLAVLQKGMLIAVETDSATSDFPKIEEFSLKAQLRRAQVSIPSNIADGQSCHHIRAGLFLLFAAGPEKCCTASRTRFDVVNNRAIEPDN